MVRRAAVWAALLLLGGCAGGVADLGAPAGPPRSPGPPTVEPRWESCEAEPSAPHSIETGDTEALVLPRLDPAFEPVAAIVCRNEVRQRPGGGRELLAVEDRADDITALVASLVLVDVDRLPAGKNACTLDFPQVPWLALLDRQGRWVRPGVPRDACHKPRAEFRAAYDGLATTRVAAQVVRQLDSDAAAASGCAQQWADMVWVTGESGGGQATVSADVLGADDAPVRACRYQVPAAERGGGKPAGEFESGGPLPVATWAAVRRALAGVVAGPAPAACVTPSSRFAVLHLPVGMVYVEADGCRRVLFDGLPTGSAALRQGTPALIAAAFPG